MSRRAGNAVETDVMQPQLSIVLCTRNRATYLPATLESYENLKSAVVWELVIVDNGSTDGTAECLKAFSGRTRIRHHFIEESRPGLSRARNAG